MPMLVWIRLLHTVVWAVLAGSILLIPVCAVRGNLRIAKLLSIAIWVECAILGLNHGRCPLTDIASQYTAVRAANFDIYLPLWLAKNNKVIFGTLFVAAEIVLLTRWVKDRRLTSSH